MRFRTFACVLSLAFTVVAAAQSGSSHFTPAASAANIPALMSIDFRSAGGGGGGQVEVLSYSWGVSNSGSMGFGSGGGEGKASFTDLNFTHTIDKSSPVLFQGYTGHVRFPQVKLTVNAQFADGSVRPFATVTLSDVLISGYAQSSDGALPVETLSLNYQNITFALVSP